MKIKKLGVLGAGQMGVGIALVSAVVSKVPVLLMDASASHLEKQMKFIDKLLSKDVAKGKISESDSTYAKSLISTSTDSSLHPFKDCDFVIEAVSENQSLKSQLFSKLDAIVVKDAILASNTSSISITKIASSTSNPYRVIGMHFMNPVPVMKLVEVIPGLQTSSETVSKTLQFAKDMGKTTTFR